MFFVIFSSSRFVYLFASLHWMFSLEQRVPKGEKSKEQKAWTCKNIIHQNDIFAIQIFGW